MAFKIPEVETCCCYISLRTGAKLFGFISLLGCLCLAGESAWELTVIGIYAKEDDEYVESLIILSADIIFQTIQVVTSILLLQGVYQEKSKWILPWLISTVANMVAEIVFLPSAPGRIIGFGYTILEMDWLILTIFMLIDDIYGWLVVYSYYRTLTSHTSNGDM